MSYFLTTNEAKTQLHAIAREKGYIFKKCRERINNRDLYAFYDDFDRITSPKNFLVTWRDLLMSGDYKDFIN